MIARAAVQLASVAYATWQREMDARRATRQAAVLSLVLAAGLVVTALIAALAILAVLSALFQQAPLEQPVPVE